MSEPVNEWPDDIALDSLKCAAGALEQLADGTAEAAELREKTQPALKALLEAIAACESAGIERNEILAHLPRQRAIHSRSPFIRRAQEWPRGYPGDFETIEYLCDGVNRAAPGTVEHELEEHALSSPITQQHRNKLKFQATKILDACRRRDGRPRILSIGCGGCRDIRSIAGELEATCAEFVLCDLDFDALHFALLNLGPIAERCTYLNAMIPRVLRRLMPYGPFDLAIAGGVFDYLPDRWVTLSVREVTAKLLAPGGEFIFTNVKRGNPFRVWMEYLANWSLIERDEEQLVGLCVAAGMDEKSVETRLEPTGLSILVEVHGS